MQRGVWTFAAALATARAAPDSRPARRTGVHWTKCRLWEHLSCLLDAFEKTCLPDTDLQEMLSPRGVESVWMCCCPEPYKPCATNMLNSLCLETLVRHIGPIMNEDRALRPVQPLQAARAELRVEGGELCEGTADGLPMARCGPLGDNGKAIRPFSRKDLTCELLAWQLEELGDGNQAEFEKSGCVFVEGVRGKDGEHRKGNRLGNQSVAVIYDALFHPKDSGAMVRESWDHSFCDGCGGVLIISIAVAFFLSCGILLLFYRRYLTSKENSESESAGLKAAAEGSPPACEIVGASNADSGEQL